MKKMLFFIGIDVAKLTLDIAYRTAGNEKITHLQISNDEQGFKQVLELIKKLGLALDQVLICLEHTGTYIEKLVEFFQARQIVVWVVHPLVMKYANPSLQRLKTDKADAKKICEFAHCFQSDMIDYQGLSNFNYLLNQLRQARKQLVKIRQQTLNMIAEKKLKAKPDPITIHVFLDLKAHLSQAIKDLDKAINQHIKSNQKANRQKTILMSTPAIGKVISTNLIVLTNGFNNFKEHQKFASFIGIAPFANQSGTSIKKKTKVSKKGHQQFKADLSQGALSVIRKGQLFHQYYHHMIKKGKPHNWIINAIMNQIIKLVFALIKNDTEFDEKRYLKSKKSWDFS